MEPVAEPHILKFNLVALCWPRVWFKSYKTVLSAQKPNTSIAKKHINSKTQKFLQQKKHYRCLNWWYFFRTQTNRWRILFFKVIWWLVLLLMFFLYCLFHWHAIKEKKSKSSNCLTLSDIEIRNEAKRITYDFFIHFITWWHAFVAHLIASWICMFL